MRNVPLAPAQIRRPAVRSRYLIWHFHVQYSRSRRSAATGMPVPQMRHHVYTVDSWCSWTTFRCGLVADTLAALFGIQGSRVEASGFGSVANGLGEMGLRIMERAVRMARKMHGSANANPVTNIRAGPTDRATQEVRFSCTDWPGPTGDDDRTQVSPLPSAKGHRSCRCRSSERPIADMVQLSRLASWHRWGRGFLER
jgi:hypothetical protein